MSDGLILKYVGNRGLSIIQQPVILRAMPNQNTEGARALAGLYYVNVNGDPHCAQRHVRLPRSSMTPENRIFSRKEAKQIGVEYGTKYDESLLAPRAKTINIHTPKAEPIQAEVIDLEPTTDHSRLLPENPRGDAFIPPDEPAGSYVEATTDDLEPDPAEEESFVEFDDPQPENVEPIDEEAAARAASQRRSACAMLATTYCNLLVGSISLATNTVPQPLDPKTPHPLFGEPEAKQMYEAAFAAFDYMLPESTPEVHPMVSLVIVTGIVAAPRINAAKSGQVPPLKEEKKPPKKGDEEAVKEAA